MKRKIVIHVPMQHEKARSKAMKMAVALNGVMSVSVGENDDLVVIGVGVDSVSLANSLRKKFCFAEIVSIEEVKPPDPPPPPPPPTPSAPPPPPTPIKTCSPPYPIKTCSPPYPYCIYPRPCPPPYYECRYIDESTPSCTIT